MGTISVTSIAASVASGTTLNPGQTVSFTVGLSTAASLTPGTGNTTPFLTLNDGGTAIYDAARSTATSLVFTYKVAAGQATPDLKVTGLNPNGATISGGGSGTLSFGTATSYAVGSYPGSLAIADLNGDGAKDLVVGNSTSDTVSVLLGDGHGGFGPAKTLAAGSSPSDVTLADLNGDGKPDIIVADSSPDLAIGGVSVLLNTGNGTFGAATSFSAGNYPDSVTAADVNGDGKLDLVTANQNSNTVSVLLGNGAGGFAAAKNFAAGSAPSSAKVVDVDGDGKVDLVVAQGGGNTVSVMRGNGTGGFAAPVAYAVGQNLISVATADLNGDGKADIVVADRNDRKLRVLLNNGSGGFGTPTSYDAGAYLYSVAVADLNGDGKADLVASTVSGTLKVLLGDGTGTFGAAATFAAGSNTHPVVVADLNGDGRPDLVTPDDVSAGTVDVLLNTTAETPVNTSGLGALPMADTGIRVDALSPVVTLLYGDSVSATLSDDTSKTSLTTSGTFSFTDPQTTDTHTLAVSAMAGDLGTLTTVLTTDSTGSATGRVTWTYQVDEAKMQALTAASNKVDTFTVTVSDGNGGTTSQTISVALQSFANTTTATLTTGNDTVVAPLTGITVNATSTTLNAGDRLTGGAGTDVLTLYNSGTFHLDQLAAFTGFEQVVLANYTNSNANVYLGSQNLAVTGLGSGYGSVFLGSGAVSYRSGTSNGSISSRVLKKGLVFGLLA